MILIGTGCASIGTQEASKQESTELTFIATADMRQFAGPEFQTSEYFLGTCEAIKEIGKGEFMVSPGDIDPPWHVESVVRKVLGEDYPWYPVVGNHESETPEDMEWLRNYGKGDLPNLIRRGPENCVETTYSFEYGNVHFAVINEYFDGQSDVGTDGNISQALYDWLENDLEENTKPIVFVIGHEPLVSLADVDTGRHRHKGDNLDAHPEENHKFQMLLKKHNVAAYLCGHTHNFSHANINGLVQIDVGHCRGLGDKGSPSTFVKFLIGQTEFQVEVYRDDSQGGPYVLTETLKLELPGSSS